MSVAVGNLDSIVLRKMNENLSYVNVSGVVPHCKVPLPLYLRVVTFVIDELGLPVVWQVGRDKMA